MLANFIDTPAPASIGAISSQRYDLNIGLSLTLKIAAPRCFIPKDRKVHVRAIFPLVRATAFTEIAQRVLEPIVVDVLERCALLLGQRQSVRHKSRTRIDDNILVTGSDMLLIVPTLHIVDNGNRSDEIFFTENLIGYESKIGQFSIIDRNEHHAVAFQKSTSQLQPRKRHVEPGYTKSLPVLYGGSM